MNFPRILLLAAIVSGGAFAQPALQSAAEKPAAKILWSETAGRLDSPEASAVITALAIADPQHAGGQFRGVRITLTSHGKQDSVYIDAREFAALSSQVHQWASGWAHMGGSAFQGTHSTNCPDEESQRLPLFLEYRTPVMVLTVRGYDGLSFTDLTPPDVAAIFTRASLRLKAQ
jgi:hypothetical protein